MADRYRIDDQKLIFHPRRVAKWLDGRDDWERAREIYPIYVEIAPVGACNHRCVFCSVDYLEYRRVSQDPEVLRARLTEMAGLGVQAIMFAGEGEPTLWPQLPAMLDHCTAVGISTSLTTNAVPLSAANSGNFVRNCAWIKVSVNAGAAATYGRLHGTKADDYGRVMRNLERCVAIRAAQGRGATLGGQMLLLPENAREAVPLARQLRDLGLDYLVLKPYTQSLYGRSTRYAGLDYTPYLGLEEELQSVATDQFRVVFRRHAMEKVSEAERAYGRCQATPFFWAYVMADGSVYGCGAFLGSDAFRYGNINEQSFQEIWQGDRRRSSVAYVRDKLDLSSCRRSCRMDNVNRYLWQLVHPDRHASFI